MSETSLEPTALPDGWHSRLPEQRDLPHLVRLRLEDRGPWTGETSVDVDGLESEIVGQASWTRRQLVLCREEQPPQAWVSVQDRAAGRAIIALWVDRTVEEAATLAASAYAWAEEQALSMARLRGIDTTRLDASPFAGDEVQLRWLADAGYAKRRSWLHMTRPVTSADAPADVRDGVVVRRVETHDNGIPVATDLQLVHRMLEESFEDHFNSYRESFPEFVQRLREDPGHRWDHWWLAFVTTEDGEAPAGALVSSVLGRDATGVRGSYVEYIGVNRLARGRGVAKGLLATVVADAAERGRNRVGLEVDADSPTSADQLYLSLGWTTDYVTESWFRDLEVPRPG